MQCPACDLESQPKLFAMPSPDDEDEERAHYCDRCEQALPWFRQSITSTWNRSVESFPLTAEEKTRLTSLFNEIVSTPNFTRDCAIQTKELGTAMRHIEMKLSENQWNALRLLFVSLVKPDQV